MAKSKMKPHKATGKVVKVRPGGTISYKHAEGNHKTNKDSSKKIRHRRKQGTLSKGDRNRLKSVI